MGFSALLTRSSGLAKTATTRLSWRGAAASGVRLSNSRSPIFVHKNMTSHRMFSAGLPDDLPDWKTLKMPSLSPTMEAGNLAAWKMGEGDEFEPGDVVAEVRPHFHLNFIISLSSVKKNQENASLFI